MIEQPNQPGRLVVHWLNLLADLQIRSGAGFEAAQQTLQRIVDRDPDVAAAEIARHRLALLKLEMKAKDKSQAVKLGSYEQNIGLTRGLPRRASCNGDLLFKLLRKFLIGTAGFSAHLHGHRSDVRIHRFDSHPDVPAIAPWPRWSSPGWGRG